MDTLQWGEEIKIVFTGPMGAGKTTAIAAISETPPLRTEVSNGDRHAFDKDMTTVALDFGEFEIGDGQVVRLYGTPGQSRFDFMWRIVGRGALGIVLLLDASSPAVMSDLDTYLDAFTELAQGHRVVIGVGRTEIAGSTPIVHIQHRLRLNHLTLPVLSVDVRRREDVLLLIEVLLSLIEAPHPQGALQ